MEHVARVLYYLGVVAISAVAILIVTMALAEPHEADESSAPTAATANDSGDGLDEVIVTAEKLGRSLMRTPTSTVVLDRRELENRAGLTTTRDLLETIPNVVLSGTGNTAPVIRGIDSTGAAQGADAFFAGSRPRLNVQVDGRALSYNEITFGDSALWDVQQVEVLRGAQSTLQGRNAIAGTIASIRHSPLIAHSKPLHVRSRDGVPTRSSFPAPICPRRSTTPCCYSGKKASRRECSASPWSKRTPGKSQTCAACPRICGLSNYRSRCISGTTAGFP